MGYADLDELRTHWDAFASLFEDTFERVTVHLVQTLCAHLRLEDAVAAIEVGAGAGAGARVLHAALPAGARLVVTDIAPNMVARARDRLPDGVEVMEANAEALPFAAGTFDRLLANLNLMLVMDPDQALAEAHRVLRPGGWAAWSVWGRPEPSTLFTLPGVAAERVGIALPASARSNFHLGDREALRARLAGRGFGRVLSWHQPMTLPVRDGVAFAELTLATPRWQKHLAGVPDEQVDALRRELAALTDAQLAAGTPIMLDALLVVAERP